MAKITLKGNEVNTNGSLPAVGAEAPDFKGVKSDLSELHLDRKSTRLNSSHEWISRMPSSA